MFSDGWLGVCHDCFHFPSLQHGAWHGGSVQHGFPGPCGVVDAGLMMLWLSVSTLVRNVYC